MPHHTPSYTFAIEGGKRTFHHRWHIRDQVYECDSCRNTCNSRDPYSTHWHLANSGNSTPTRLQLSATQQRQLNAIEAQRVQLFMLCNERVAGQTQHFLLEAGMNAVPELLRLLFCGAAQLQLKLGFYVRIRQEELLFQSSELRVLNHFDVPESVDLLFYMLLEKIGTYVSALASANDLGYKVQRIRVQVKRLKASMGQDKGEHAVALALPLQYRVKHAVLDVLNDSHEAAMAIERQHLSYHTEEARSSERLLQSVTDSYKRHLHTGGLMPLDTNLNVNLYTFQVCRDSRELFAVPYHMRDHKHMLHTQSYIILENVLGKFQLLQEITHVRRFFRHDAADRVLICRNCQAKFVQQTTYELHKMLQCGRNFEVLKVAADAIEIYEHCLSMQCEAFQWAVYGIMP